MQRDHEGGGKRLFLAVDIDDATREQVARISSRLREVLDAHVRASWVRADRMHLTLHFFGDADGDLESRVRGLVAAPLAQHPFELSFAGLGCFPERGSPRVIWLGIREGLDDLRRLHQTLLPSAGELSPHLTLARVRDRIPRAKFDEMARAPASAGPTLIDRVTLYESRLSPAGPTYTRLAEAPLRST